jgi:Spy/CpxP family protein refolding chaperone
MSILLRVLSLSLLLLAAFATASSARPPWGRGGQDRGPAGLLEEHADQLGLDEETREAIRDVVRESRESNEKLRDELRGLHREMKETLSQADPDESAVMLLADRIGLLETSLHKHRLAAMLEIRSALTPEQREQLAELREQDRSRHFEPVADACRGDALRLCSDAEGRFERMRCMREHRDEVSDACREAFQDLRRDRPHTRWGGGR